MTVKQLSLHRAKLKLTRKESPARVWYFSALLIYRHLQALHTDSQQVQISRKVCDSPCLFARNKKTFLQCSIAILLSCTYYPHCLKYARQTKAEPNTMILIIILFNFHVCSLEIPLCMVLDKDLAYFI